jgi:hypothetical protein
MEPSKGISNEELQKFKVTKSLIQIRTINVIKKWLEIQAQDFYDDEVNHLLECFLRKLIAAGLKVLNYFITFSRCDRKTVGR